MKLMPQLEIGLFNGWIPQHFGILAEEEACVKRYGESYRAYMKKVPRYVPFL